MSDIKIRGATFMKNKKLRKKMNLSSAQPCSPQVIPQKGAGAAPASYDINILRFILHFAVLYNYSQIYSEAFCSTYNFSYKDFPVKS